MIRLMPALLGAAIVIAGCASRQPIQGWSPDPRPSGGSAVVGQPYVDFKFIDDQGRERPLGRELGDFTVLALTRCDDPSHGPAVDVLQSFVDGPHAPGNVKVVGVDIHWSPGGCADHHACHQVAEAPRLDSICDPTGAVHRAYGDHRESWYYLIRGDRTIALAAPAARAAEFRTELLAQVQRLSRERAEAPFQSSLGRP